MYFHPNHLKLEFVKGPERFTVGKKDPKLWVRLADITWVLDPSRMRAEVRSVDDDEGESDAYKSSRFEALKVLSRYFVAQMEMFSEICLNRQINAIVALRGSL